MITPLFGVSSKELIIVDVDPHDALEKVDFGGMILLSSLVDLEHKETVCTFLNTLQEIRKVKGYSPLIFMVDQEGGRVSHLKGEFFTPPSPSVWGALEEKEIYEIALQVAKEMKEVGIHINLAPVVDLKREGWIKERTISHDPEEVVRKVTPWISAFEECGVYSCLKHYPGYSSSSDTHTGMCILSKEWSEKDLHPFHALKGELTLVMVSHLLIDGVPASCHPDIYANLQDRFTITDSMWMKGVRKLGLKESVLKAFQSGVDMVLISGVIEGEKVTLHELEEIVSYVDTHLSSEILEQKIMKKRKFLW